MSSSWITQVATNPVTGVLLRREKLGHRDTGRGHEKTEAVTGVMCPQAREQEFPATMRC